MDFHWEYEGIIGCVINDPLAVAYFLDPSYAAESNVMWKWRRKDLPGADGGGFHEFLEKRAEQPGFDRDGCWKIHALFPDEDSEKGRRDAVGERGTVLSGAAVGRRRG